MKTSTDKFLAALWGLAEATVFFVVPDVLLSWYALDNIKRGLLACLYALAGALLGGALVWYWGYLDPDSANALFASLPGINEALIDKVQAQSEDLGLMALMVGPLSGTPYKLYAAAAPGLNQGLLVFLLVSVPARLIRFVIVTTLIGVIAKLLRKWLKPETVMTVHLAGWAVFYAGYFWIMSAN